MAERGGRDLEVMRESVMHPACSTFPTRAGMRTAPQCAQAALRRCLAHACG